MTSQKFRISTFWLCFLAIFAIGLSEQYVLDRAKGTEIKLNSDLRHSSCYDIPECFSYSAVIFLLQGMESLKIKLTTIP